VSIPISTETTLEAVGNRIIIKYLASLWTDFTDLVMLCDLALAPELRRSSLIPVSGETFSPTGSLVDAFSALDKFGRPISPCVCASSASQQNIVLA
jgi:hypothetical protein